MIMQTELGSVGSFGGDLTDFGQTGSLYGKNIRGNYRGPKEELDFKDGLENFEDLSMQSLLSLIPENWFEENDNDYWEDDVTGFWGKDGQTNAYVKQGVDNEIVEYLDRQQTNQYVWQFATDDNHIYFKVGGKVYARGREWFIVKVITQDNTSTTTNKYNAMDTSPKNKRLLQFGLKTLVLI